MRAAVVGAGCVGSVVATRIHDLSQAEVGFVASGGRARSLEEDGLVVNGVGYRLPVLKEGDQLPDVLFVCVKSYQLDQACEDMRPYVGEGTVLVSLLNGVTAVPALKSRFPENEVLYGYISKIDTLRSGNQFDYHIAGDIHFGRRLNDCPDPLLESIRSLLLEAGFGVSIDRDMIRAIWKKWMLNVGANQVSALSEADYVQFSSIPEIEKVLRLAMDELLMLAHRENVKLLQSDVEELVSYLTTYPYPKKTSMLQDVLARRKTEIESISGEVLALGKKWGQPCPVNETMFYLVRAKEQAYLQGGEL